MSEIKHTTPLIHEVEILDWLDSYGLQVLYDGTNEFYDEERMKHARAGIDFILKIAERVVQEQQAEIDKLEYWKESQMKQWGPVLDYAQKHGKELGIRPGEWISEKVLQILKERSEQAQRIQEQQAELDKLKEVVERTPHLNRIVFLERRLDERRLRQEQLERALREALPYIKGEFPAYHHVDLREKIESLLSKYEP